MLLVLILRLYLLGHTVVLIQILLPVLFLLLLFIHTITPELVCQNKCFLCTGRCSALSYYSIFKVPLLILKFELHIGIIFFKKYYVNHQIRNTEFQTVILWNYMALQMPPFTFINLPYIINMVLENASG